MRKTRTKNPEYFRNKRTQYRDNNPHVVERIKKNIRKKRLNNPQWYLWDKAKRRALKSGIKFNIEISDVIIPERCPALGIPLRVLSGSDNSPTIDRVDNRFGYIKGNIAVISMRANTIKNCASIEELEKILSFCRLFSDDQVDEIKKLIAGAKK